jgi:hypothetical protein
MPYPPDDSSSPPGDSTPKTFWPQTLANVSQVLPPIADIYKTVMKSKVWFPQWTTKGLDAYSAINLALYTENGSSSFYSNTLGAISSGAGAFQFALSNPKVIRLAASEVFKHTFNVSVLDAIMRMPGGARAEAFTKFYHAFGPQVPVLTQFMTNLLMNDRPPSKHQIQLEVQKHIKAARSAKSLQNVNFGSNYYRQQTIEFAYKGVLSSKNSLVMLSSWAQRLGYLGLTADTGVFGLNAYALYRAMTDPSADDKKRAEAVVGVAGSMFVLVGGLMATFPTQFYKRFPVVFRTPSMPVIAGLAVILQGKFLLSAESQWEGWPSSRVAPIPGKVRAMKEKGKDWVQSTGKQILIVSEEKAVQAKDVVVRAKARAKEFWSRPSDASTDEILRILQGL